jgi:hypothetical protein
MPRRRPKPSRRSARSPSPSKRPRSTRPAKPPREAQRRATLRDPDALFPVDLALIESFKNAVSEEDRAALEAVIAALPPETLAAIDADVDAFNRRWLEQMARRYAAKQKRTPAECEALVEEVLARHHGAPPSTPEAEAAVEAFGRAVDGGWGRTPQHRLLNALDQDVAKRIAEVQRRRAEASSIEQRLEWLMRVDHWRIDRIKKEEEDARKAREAAQTRVRKLCEQLDIPLDAIVAIGETARDQVRADEFRFKELEKAGVRAKQFALFREHGAEFPDAIDFLIEWGAALEGHPALPRWKATRLSPDERAAVHEMIARLRVLWPTLRSLSESLPLHTARSGIGAFIYRKPGKPSHKGARDGADRALRRLGVPYKDRALLFLDWGLVTPDEPAPRA